MRVAVIGSRGLTIENIGEYLPKNTSEIVSGGAKGVDNCAKEYAIKHNIKLTEFLPNYRLYKKGAPLKRNKEIVDYSDTVLAFWDSKSKGTKFVIDYCKKHNKKCEVIIVE